MSADRTDVKLKTYRVIARWLKSLPAEVLDQPILLSTGSDEFEETILYPKIPHQFTRFSGGYAGPVLLV